MIRFIRKKKKKEKRKKSSNLIQQVSKLNFSQ